MTFCTRAPPAGSAVFLSLNTGPIPLVVAAIVSLLNWKVLFQHHTRKNSFMNRKMEGQFDDDHPMEPWSVVPLDDTDGELYSPEGKACYGRAIPLPEANRIAATINFCREFDTEFLENHTLRYLDSSNASVAMALPLQPGFVGLIACFQKEGE